MGAGEGGGSKLWSIIWFIVLITVAFELAFVCAALYILLNPLTLCIEGLKVKLTHLKNNYFQLQVCLSFRPSLRLWVRHTLGFQVASQYVTNKSSLVCVKSEKYAFGVTLRLLGSMQQGKAEPCTIYYLGKAKLSCIY